MTGFLTLNNILLRALLVFLDLPAPWDAVASAKKAFKQDRIGKICTFSPCIEQISRTVTALNDEGFVDIQMYECLIRFNEIRVIPLWTIEQAMEKQRAVELKRKRAPRVVREDNTATDGEENKKAKIEDDSNQSSAAGTPVTNPDSEIESAPASASATPSTVSTPVLASEETTTSTSTVTAPRERIDPVNVVVTKLPVEQRGHTSYLMFATFTPTTQHPNLTQLNAEAAAAKKE